MILLTIFNFLISLGNSILGLLFQNAIPVLDNLTLWVTNVSVPQTLLNIFALVVYFLPMGTISVLFGFTVTIVLTKIASSLIHLFTLGKIL